MEIGGVDAWDLIDSFDGNSSSSPGISLELNSNDGSASDSHTSSVEGSELGSVKNGNASPQVILKKTKGTYRSKRDNEPEAKQSTQLPPCLVCSGVSSGFHFGVVTCESCKVFFRRSLSRTTPYFCNRKKACVVTSGKRSNCSFCRLEKCVEVGMSKDGVKKGRYTLERKQDYQTMVERHEHKEKEKREEEERQKELDLQMMRNTVERLRRLHEKHQLITPEVIERVKCGEVKRKEYKKALEDAVGPMPPITPDEAREFLKATGVDITGYRDAAKSCASICIDRYSAAYVSYLKDLNEFMELSLPDRIIILKGAVQTWLCVSIYEIVNIQDFTMSCFSCGKCFSEDEFRMFSTSKEYRAYFRPIMKLLDQNFTEDEKAIIRAFVVFDTSQCSDGLQEPKKVDAFQEFFTKCLLHVLEKNRGKENAVKAFSTIIDVITESRSIQAEKRAMIDRSIELLSDIKYSKFSAEIYNLPECVVADLGDGISNLQL